MATEDRIEQLRVMIDAVDDELLHLLSRRAALTIDVGEVKRAGGVTTEFYRPEREARILRRLLAANPGPLPDEALARVMREIISTCLSLEHALRIAYLGPEGTYTHAAVLKHFGGAVEPVTSASVGEVFREVEARACDYGVVPIENSVGGSVNQTLDCLSESSLRICAEIVLAVHHQLLSNVATLADVQRVYAHEQALAQCRGWLDRHLPTAERIALGSNAAAAQRARQEVGSAAIASIDAGQRYGLTALASNIEDFPHNTTRFAVLGRAIPRASGDDVTSAMFGLPNKPGALHGILSVLAERGISMSRIESRPARNRMWDYLFFVDLLGHSEDAVVAAALAEIETRASLFKLLGSYPRAIL
jgi:chorismate mutase / prephenate dehydratase